MTIPLPAIRS
jgi:hypothetical protein